MLQASRLPVPSIAQYEQLLRFAADFGSSTGARSIEQRMMLWEWINRSPQIRQLLPPGISESDRVALLDGIKFIAVAEGGLIYRQGDGGTSCYVVLLGAVEVRHRIGQTSPAQEKRRAVVRRGSGAGVVEGSEASEFGDVIGIVQGGSHFGHASAFGRVRDSTARSLGYAEPGLEGVRKAIVLVLDADVQAACPLQLASEEAAVQARMEHMSKLFMFSDWPREELHVLSQWCTDQVVSQGQLIYRQHGPIDGIHFLTSGAIQLSIARRHGSTVQEIVIEYVEAPMMYGEMELVSDVTAGGRNHSATAMTAVTLTLMPPQVVSSMLMSQNASVQFNTHVFLRGLLRDRNLWHAMRIEDAEVSDLHVAAALLAPVQARMIPSALTGKKDLTHLAGMSSPPPTNGTPGGGDSPGGFGGLSSPSTRRLTKLPAGMGRSSKRLLPLLSPPPSGLTSPKGSARQFPFEPLESPSPSRGGLPSLGSTRRMSSDAKIERLSAKPSFRGLNEPFSIVDDDRRNSLIESSQRAIIANLTATPKRHTLADAVRTEIRGVAKAVAAFKRLVHRRRDREARLAAEALAAERAKILMSSNHDEVVSGMVERSGGSVLRSAQSAALLVASPLQRVRSKYVISQGQAAIRNRREGAAEATDLSADAGLKRAPSSKYLSRNNTMNRDLAASRLGVAGSSMYRIATGAGNGVVPLAGTSSRLAPLGKLGAVAEAGSGDLSATFAEAVEPVIGSPSAALQRLGSNLGAVRNGSGGTLGPVRSRPSMEAIPIGMSEKNVSPVTSGVGRPSSPDKSPRRLASLGHPGQLQHSPSLRSGPGLGGAPLSSSPLTATLGSPAEIPRGLASIGSRHQMLSQTEPIPVVTTSGQRTTAGSMTATTDMPAGASTNMSTGKRVTANHQVYVSAALGQAQPTLARKATGRETPIVVSRVSESRGQSGSKGPVGVSPNIQVAPSTKIAEAARASSFRRQASRSGGPMAFAFNGSTSSAGSSAASSAGRQAHKSAIPLELLEEIDEVVADDPDSSDDDK